MTIGMLGILVEIRTLGFAVPGTIGLLSLGLFFWGQWLVQLAGWEELLLVAAGVLLVGHSRLRYRRHEQLPESGSK